MLLGTVLLFQLLQGKGFNLGISFRLGIGPIVLLYKGLLEGFRRGSGGHRLTGGIPVV